MAFITPLSARIKLLPLVGLLLLLLMPSAQVSAENINPTRAAAVVRNDGRMNVSSRFHTELPPALQQVLKQGVPLHFTLSYRLSAPTFAAYRFKLGRFISSGDTISYKLSYHPLTNRYRLSVGTFSSEYGSLDTALRGIGAIANWQVLPKGALEDTGLHEIQAEIRLTLSTSQLPKPFQIHSLTSQNWNLDSGWKPLNISKE